MNKFIKIGTILILLFICFSSVYATEETEFEIPTTYQLQEMKIEKENKDYDFLQALKLYYNYTKQMKDLNLQSEKDNKKCLSEAKKLMEKFTEINDLPIYSAFRGNIISLALAYEKFPFVVFESKKAISLLNKAVIKDNDNAEIRFYRLTSFCYYPKKYYDFEEIILEDSEIVDNWLEKLLEDKSNLDIYYNALYNQAFMNFAMGRYYFVEMEDKEKAKKYFSKMPNNLPSKPSFYEEMEKMKKEMSKK